jgi:hypothetical protein
MNQIMDSMRAANECEFVDDARKYAKAWASFSSYSSQWKVYLATLEYRLVVTSDRAQALAR